MNSDNEQQPRFLGRRFLATILDYLFFTVLIAVLTFPLSANLASSFRGGVGFFNLNACGPGQMFTPDNQPVKLDGWDGINVCDTKVDFVFPYRAATIYKQTTETINGTNTTFSRYLTFQLNDKNQIAYPLQLSLFAPFMLVVLAAFAERIFGLTPGKKIAGVFVEAHNGGSITIGASLIRNTLKYSALLAWSIWAILTTPYAEKILKNSIQADGVIRMPSELEIAVSTTASYWMLNISISIAVTLLLLIVPLSLFFNWNKIKKGIHDRVAKTEVVRD